MRSLCLLILLFGKLAIATNTTNGQPRYDFIIVGGGTSGLVVANRLSENPNVTVAIIEAGPSVETNTDVTDINGYGRAFGTYIDWQYKTVPQTHAGGKQQTLRAGKALGGTSTFNGFTHLRAEAAQIDAWEQLGNPGWNWASLMQYYKKSEHLQTPTADQELAGGVVDPQYHGYSGPLDVGFPDSLMNGSIVGDINGTFQALGLPYNADANSGNMRGFNIPPKTLNRGQNVREDAARAYYWPVTERSNLVLFLNSSVERMIWDPVLHNDKSFAKGVILTSSTGMKRTILANKEIILSAGALRSPLILEQSGIGNPAILKKYNIPAIVNNPYVGENLQDQTTSDMTYASNTDFNGDGGYIGYFSAKDIFGNTTSFNQTVYDHLSSYAQEVANATGTSILNMTATEKLFRIQHDLIFNQNLPVSEIIISPSNSGSITIGHWSILPFSRGNIHITSSTSTFNPSSGNASINPNYLLLPYDKTLQIATSKKSRQIATTAPLSAYTTSETAPSLDTVPLNATDAVWESWVQASYRSNYHYISTTAMMARELGGVVDYEFVVYGTGNVRVVDAGVLPMQVCGHLAATIYAVAEKAADVIKARYAAGSSGA